MNEQAQEKPWWESVGVNGSVSVAVSGLVILIGAAAKAFGYEIDPSALTEALLGLWVVGSSAATWYGRVRAKQPISKTMVLPGVTLKSDKDDEA